MFAAICAKQPSDREGREKAASGGHLALGFLLFAEMSLYVTGHHGQLERGLGAGAVVSRWEQIQTATDAGSAAPGCPTAGGPFRSAPHTAFPLRVSAVSGRLADTSVVAPFGWSCLCELKG